MNTETSAVRGTNQATYLQQDRSLIVTTGLWMAGTLWPTRLGL